MSQSVEIPWGKSSLKIDLPKRWRILGELKPQGLSQPVDLFEFCARALASPIGSERLASRNLTGKKALIVVDDHSRPTPVKAILPAILNELRTTGISEECVEFLIATGVHRASTPEEVADKLGAAIIAKHSWNCHNSYDLSNLADMGFTKRGTKVLLNKKLLEADLIVCVGCIEPHLLMGFGGGLKMIIPGCAGAETIGINHMQGVDPEHFNYVGSHAEHSPMRQDLEEGASLLRRDIFIVNTVMSERAQPVSFFCGDSILAHRAGERFVENTSKINIPEQSDVVITNSFPMDSDLRQSVKCIGNTLNSAKPGGIMVGLARAINGLGEMPLARHTLPYPVIRAIVRIIGGKGVLPLVKMAKKNEPLEELFIGHFGLQMLRRNHVAIFSDSSLLRAEIGKIINIAKSFTSIQPMMDWVVAKAPETASVWVFPNGGATYASFEKSEQ